MPHSITLASPEEMECAAPTHYQREHEIPLTTAPTTPLVPAEYQEVRCRHTSSRSRSRSRPTVLSTLKTIICKDWPAFSQHTPQPERVQVIQRPIMRMKDSDDYITARGANPRTGLISPSVGTRTPCTPDSPGDALRLRNQHQHSPTPIPRSTPPISRANEGRKISGGNVRKWSANEDGWYIESLNSSPSSQQQPLHAHAHVRPESSCSSHLKDDEFVVHMPSAREPQPFAYPGYSADQIEAYEHYRAKSRCVSNEGYDRRLVHASHVSGNKPSTSGATDHRLGHGEVEDELIYCSITGQYFRAYRDITNHDVSEPPRISVRKRATNRNKQQDNNEAHGHVDEGNKHGVLFAPFTSPKTPAISRPSDEIPRSLPGAYRNTKHAQKFSVTAAISGDKGSAPSRSNVANGDHYHELVDCKILKKSPRLAPHSDSSSPPPPPAADLRQLPRVRLIRPECAALPNAHCQDGRRRSSHGGGQCSFGCERQVSSGECMERRFASAGTVRRVSPFEAEPPSSTPEQATALPSPASHAEIALGVLEALLRYITHIKIPKSGQMETLMTKDAPTQERVEALKAVVSVAAHALAVCTTLAMLWKLGSAVMHLLEVVLWPLAVPFKVMRWIVGGG